MPSFRHPLGRIFRLRRLLPLSQLIICFLVVWPMRSYMLNNIQEISSSKRQHHNYVIRVSPDVRELTLQLERLRSRPTPQGYWYQMPTALNLPVEYLQAPYLLVKGQEWVPAGMDFRVWRALTWPFFGILFWWVAGRGLEAFLPADSGNLVLITWPELLLALLSFLTGVILAIAMVSDATFRAEMPLVGWGAALWITLGCCSVVAFVRQRYISLAAASGHHYTIK